MRSMANAWLPVPGWTGAHEWQGTIPFEDLARMRNPDTGFIVTANNRVAGTDFPYYIALNFVPEYRARRIHEHLAALVGATPDHMRAVHADRISLPGQVLTKLISDLESPNGACLEAKEILGSWDGAMEKDAVAPTIYSAFRIKLLRKIISHLLGPLTGEMFVATGRGAPRHLNDLASWLATMSKENDRTFLPPGTDWKTIAGEALVEGVDYLKQRLGGDMSAWQWGKVHHTQPKHPLSDVYPEVADLLDPRSVPMGGDGDTPQAAGYSPGNPFTVTLSSVVRYVFDLSDWDRSGWAVPLGVSGHPGSSHYTDQVAVWSDVNLIPMLYGWDRIQSEAESIQRVEPDGWL
jgi:penicillin amidase